MKSGSITPSEMICLHEILNYRNTSALKAVSNKPQVNDQRLSKILEQDIAMTKQQLQDLKNVVAQTSAAGG